MTYTGGCLCGAIRYEAGATPRWVSHCHCLMCRKQTGAMLATYVCFPAGTVRWLASEPTRYQSSDDVQRSFCPTCGSTIGFHRVHETSLAVVTLDHPEHLDVDGIPHVHVWHQERVAWFDTTDDWPRYERFPQRREAELARLSGQTIRG